MDVMLYEGLAATKPPCLGCLGPIPENVLPPVLGQVRLMLPNLVKPAGHSSYLASNNFTKWAAQQQCSCMCPAKILDSSIRSMHSRSDSS